MKYSLLFLITTLTLGGCCLHKPASVGTTERIVVRDSIIERWRDTVIYVDIEKTVNTAVLPDTDTSVLDNKYARSQAYVARGLLHHTLEQKPQSLPVDIRYVDREHVVTRDSVVYQTITIEVNRLTPWQSTRLMLGNIFGIVLALLSLYGVWRLWRGRLF